VLEGTQAVRRDIALDPARLRATPAVQGAPAVPPAAAAPASPR